MIKLLKESTFHIKDVMTESVRIMSRKYIPIASICFLLFLITTFSSVMSQMEFENVIYVICYKLFGLIVTLLLFFIFYLFLLKYILGIVDKAPHVVFDSFNFPTSKQILRVIMASILFVLAVILAYLALSVVIFPLVQFRWITIPSAITIITFLGGVFFVYLLVKVSFFPLFIVDKNVSPLRSIKMSFALTRGNFLKIVMLFGLLLFMYAFYVVLYYFDQVILSMVINLLTSFVVVPLSSVVIAVAYRTMMNAFKGKIDSDILDNII